MESKPITARDITLIELRQQHKCQIRKTFIKGLVAGLLLGLAFTLLVHFGLSMAYL